MSVLMAGGGGGGMATSGNDGERAVEHKNFDES